MNGQPTPAADPPPSSGTEVSDVADVSAALDKLNRAWQEHRYGDLAAVMDPGIVMAVPGFSRRVSGRDALVESYREFMERVTMTGCRLEPAVISVWDDTAVATFRWSMEWIAGGVANHATGGDAFVFRRLRPGVWVAVWRTMSADPEPPSA